MERLRQTVGMIRPAVRAVPPPELRQRTLDYVATLGRPRGAAAVAAATSAASSPAAGLGGSSSVVPVAAVSPGQPRSARRRSGPARWALVGALAAALAVAVFGGGVLVGGNGRAAGGDAAEIDALGDVARWTMRVDGQPDARRVALASADGSPTSATVLFSPSSTDLVVVADQLAPAPAGMEYRCWVDVGGVRKPIGKMFFGGKLAYWVGPVAAVAGLPDHARFGVTLVNRASPDPAAQPVLTGEG
jgi:hypothetical protein